MIVASLKAAIKPAYQKIMDALPAHWHVVADYFRVYHRLPDLKNPRTFSEKIMWRKLYERDQRMPDLVDKIRVKQIMAKRFGEEFIIPTLAVYNSAEELDFTKEPLSQAPFFLKASHGSGMNVIVRKGEVPNSDNVRKKVEGFLACNHAAVAEEWAYSYVQPRVFVEPYLEDAGRSLVDYKFHIFDGNLYVIEAIVDRFRNYGVCFFDREWKKLNIGYAGKYPSCKNVLAAPSRLGDMIKIAETIGKDFSYVRVDLYQIDGAVKFGEITFYPGAGHDKFSPPEWDDKFGQQWKLEKAVA